jgi:hypothetical protein
LNRLRRSVEHKISGLRRQEFNAAFFRATAKSLAREIWVQFDVLTRAQDITSHVCYMLRPYQEPGFVGAQRTVPSEARINLRSFTNRLDFAVALPPF